MGGVKTRIPRTRTSGSGLGKSLGHVDLKDVGGGRARNHYRPGRPERRFWWGLETKTWSRTTRSINWPSVFAQVHSQKTSATDKISKQRVQLSANRV